MTMGRGNWFPGNSLEECEVVYVEIRSYTDDPDDDLDEWAYQDFREYLKECLGETFDCKPAPREVGYRFDSVGRDDQCFGFNGLFGVFLDGQGDSGHMGIGVIVRQDAPSFAKSGLSAFSRRLFNKLQERYKLSVRTSAWTSAERTLTALQK
jgi:hypothetical protein